MPNLATVSVLLTLVLAGIGLSLHPGNSEPLLYYFDGWLGQVVRFSLWQAGLSACASCLLAIPFALVLASQPFRGQWLLSGLLSLFFITPVLIVVLTVVVVYGRWFNVFSLEGILLAHLYLNLPYAIRIFWSRLAQLPQEQKNTALLLRLSPWTAFRILYWPALSEVLRPVFVLVFLLCFSSFTVVLTLGGGPANTNLEVAIYQALKFDFDPRAAALYAALHMLIVVVLVAVLQRQFALQLPTALLRQAAHRLPNPWQWLTLWLLLSLLLLPLGALFHQALAHSWQPISGLSAALQLSALLALGSASLTLLLAVSAGLASGQHRVMSLVDLSLLVAPLMVIATGLLLLALRFEVAFAVTHLLVIWLHSLMALPLVSPLARQRLVFARAQTNDLAMALAMPWWTRFRYLYLPALAPVLPWILAMSLVLSLGDLGIVTLVGSGEFITLPMLIYQAMGSYQMALAVQLSLLLLALCAAILIAAEWFGERARVAG